MKFPFLAHILLDIDEICEFAEVANEDVKKEIAGHVSSIGRVSTDLVDLDAGLDVSEIGGYEDDGEKLDPQDKLRRIKGQLLAGISLLSELLRDYDVAVGFNLQSQSLVFVKCSGTLSKEGVPCDFDEELANGQNEIAFAPLSQGTINGYYKFADGTYRYKMTASGLEDDEELDILNSVDVDLDQLFAVGFGFDDDENDDEDFDDDDEGEEWKKGKSDDDEG